jgi:hypothetical protein
MSCVTYWLQQGPAGVRWGFNLCVAPSQDAVSYFGGGENIRAFGWIERDEGKA